MGRSASLFEWKSRDVWRVICRCDADACGASKTAPFDGDLSDGDGFELSRELDVSRRRIRTVVQPIMEFRAGGKHGNAALEQFEDGDGWNEHIAAYKLFRAEARGAGSRSVLSRLAGASELR